MYERSEGVPQDYATALSWYRKAADQGNAADRGSATAQRNLGVMRHLASATHRKGLLLGKPVYLGYITSAYKVASGRLATRPHDYWEARIAPRARDRIIEDLKKVDQALVPFGSNKVGAIKNFHSLAPQAQSLGLPIGKLRGNVNPGYYAQVDEAKVEFEQLAREIAKRMGVKRPSVAA